MHNSRFVNTAAVLLAAGSLWIPAATAAATVPAVHISPSTTSVRLNASAAFTASNVPTGITVAWKAVGGGTIDAAGKYTAPAVMPSSPNPATVTIQAVDSAAPANVLATATVTLLNPIPVIHSFSPTVLNVGLATTLKITGTGFVPGSTVQFNGAKVAATYVSTTEMDYAVPAPAATGSHAVAIINPTPDGRTSNTATININAAVAVNLSVATIVRGGVSTRVYASVSNNPDQALNFTVNNIANGNSAVGKIAKDPATGNLLYTAPDILPAGAAVTIAATAVVDPKATKSVIVNLQNPLPVVTAVTPAPPAVIGTTETLTLTGAGFIAASTVKVGGVDFTPALVSPTTLKATGKIPAVPGRELAIVVSNPAPGPISSTPFLLAETTAKCTASDCLSYSDAVRFLERASWGPSPDAIAHLQAIGRQAWLNEQFAMPSPNPVFPPPAALTDGPGAIQTHFFTRALNDPDQLRQRVAFALSEIFVVSATKDQRYEAMRRYMQDLTDNAFGTYRNLLGVMTLNPAMGWFLDMVNNNKANPAKGTLANENYAREVIQLFSVGLTILNQDGTPTTTPPTPTYDDNCIPSTDPTKPVCLVPELAKVFTGWTYAPEPPATGAWPNPQWFESPMVAYDSPAADHHDETQKNITLAGSTAPCIINANQSALTDLNQALDCIASHPNVAPFISLRLIQRLVKSDPSHAYVKRVATIFQSSGGNLQQVVNAILTDTEATTDPAGAADAGAPAGKLREPVLFATTLLRSLNASAPTSADGVAGQSTNMGQQVLYAPSVFNYFSPFYRIPSNGVGAPEFQILNASSAIARLNFVYFTVTRGTGGNLKVDLSGFAALPSAIVTDPVTKLNSSPLIDAIEQTLYRGKLPQAVRDALVTLTGELAAQKASANLTAQTMLYFAAIAPQYQVQQ